MQNRRRLLTSAIAYALPYGRISIADADTPSGFIPVGLAVNSTAFHLPENTTVIRTSGFAKSGLGGACYKLTDKTGLLPGILMVADGRMFELLEFSPTPEMFGAVGDRHNDDGAALTDANSYCIRTRKALDFGSGEYRVADAAFILDASRTSWFSTSQAAIHWDAPPKGGVAVTVLGSSEYTNRYQQNREVIHGIALLGGTMSSQFPAVALQLGDGTAQHSLSHCKFSSSSIQGFQTALKFTDHVYFVQFDNVGIQWGSIITPKEPTDFGEAMIFSHCFIADMQDNACLTLSSGEWRFEYCSIDNATLIAEHNVVVDFDGGHFENPGNPDPQPRFLVVRDEACVTLSHTFIVINKSSRGCAISRPVFLCTTSQLSSAGLIIDSCEWVQGGNFDPRAGGYIHRSLCEGLGSVRVRSCQILAWENANFFSLGEGAQELINGNFADGSTRGWATREMGDGQGISSFSVEKDTSVGGGYVGHASLSTSTGERKLTVYQRVPVRPREIICGGLRTRTDYKVLHTDLSPPTISLRWRSSGGEDLGNAVLAIMAVPDDGFQYQQIGQIAPGGAAFADIEISVTTNHALHTVNLWFDHALINIVH